MKNSQNQKIILGLLTIIVVGLLALGFELVYITYRTQLVLDDEVIYTVTVPLHIPLKSSPSQASTLPFTFTPTFTPTTIPSPNLVFTPFIMPTQIIVPSLTPITRGQSSSPTPIPQQNPTQKAVIDCSPQLNYAKSKHQYNLARIDSIYRPSITYYENLIDQAIRDRDALAVIRYRRELDSIKRQYDAAINAENSRYEGEAAYIKSTCQ